MANELDKLLTAGVSTTPRTLTGKAREQWNEAVEKLAKGEGNYGAHGARKKIARFFVAKYKLNCDLRTVQNNLTDDIRQWREQHGQ